MIDKHTPYYVDEEGDLRFDYHEGQRRMMNSQKRFILVLAGTQSGKTVSGPWWLFREICRCGPGDYLVVAPNFPLLKKKSLPEFKRLFQERLNLGTYHETDKIFTFSKEGQQSAHGAVGDEPTKVFFGYAEDPDSLESATAKAAWLDEAGQKKFKLGSWEAIQRRLSIYQGRVLITTTPYTLGWMKSELHDAAKKDGNIELIQFESIMNPAFPQAEFDRMKAKLPKWKFNMMYRGRFERPAGMIYDCWDRDVHVIPQFSIPEEWPRFLGMDFGGVNTVGVFVANEPGTNRYVAYRTYHAGSRTAAEHKRKMIGGEPRTPKAVGGAKSEGQWRREFRTAGLAVEEPPVSEVEVGIDRVYGMLKSHPELEGTGDPYLEVMNHLNYLLDEFESYSRVLDDEDEPTEKIEDKNAYHHLDATRYVASKLVHGRAMTGKGFTADIY